MPSHNLVTITLGPRAGKVKWDTMRDFFAWLLDRNESHELGSTLVEGLTKLVYGETLRDCRIRAERPMGNDSEALQGGHVVVPTGMIVKLFGGQRYPFVHPTCASLQF